MWNWEEGYFRFVSSLSQFMNIKTVLVTGIRDEVTWRELRSWAEQIGNKARFVDVFRDRRGLCGKVEYESEEGARNAVRYLDGDRAFGGKLAVQKFSDPDYDFEYRPRDRGNKQRYDHQQESTINQEYRDRFVSQAPPHEQQVSSQPSSAPPQEVTSLVTGPGTFISPETEGEEVISSSLSLGDCLHQMKKMKFIVNETHQHSFLVCHQNNKLSDRFQNMPDYLLIRQSTVDMITLFKEAVVEIHIQLFLITGTPGIGKTVSMMVWLHMALHDELLYQQFKMIIVDSETFIVLFTRNPATGWWEETLIDRTFFKTHWIRGPKVLYLYDATSDRQPIKLPCCCVVFSSPNLQYFKSFINVSPATFMTYYMPTWDWKEIEALYVMSPQCQSYANEREDVMKLFEVWGGIPRQIFSPYPKGLNALNNAIRSSNAIACIQNIEKGSFLSDTTENTSTAAVRTRLMQLEVIDDGTYEHAKTNFGSSFIRDELIRQSGYEFPAFYREFLRIHGPDDEYATTIRGNLYEKLVVDKLRSLCCNDMNVLCFTMEEGKPNTPFTIYRLPVVSQPPIVYSSLQEINSLDRVWISKQSNFQSFDVFLALPLPAIANWVQITVEQTHSLLVSDVEKCMQFHSDSEMVFCLPPDIFRFWHEHNSVQQFVIEGGNTASIHAHHLKQKKQTVWCIPADTVEEQDVQIMMEEVSKY